MNSSNNFAKLKPFIIPTILGLATVGLAVQIKRIQRELHRQIAGLEGLNSDILHLQLEYGYRAAKDEYKFVIDEYAYAKNEYNYAKDGFEYAKKLYDDALAAYESTKLEFDDEELFGDNINCATNSTIETEEEDKPDEISGS